MKIMTMISNSLWCLLVIATFSSSQEINVTVGGANLDSVTVQELDVNVTDNGRSGSDNSSFNLLNLNNSVINNSNNINNAVGSSVKISENSSSVRYSNFDSLIGSVQSPKPDNNSVVLTSVQPESDSTVSVESSENSSTTTTGSAVEENAQIINGSKDDEESDVKSFQLESSSQSNEAVTGNVDLTDNVERVTTDARVNDEVDNGWSDEVTQIDQEYKTTIIFTNLYSPGEDVVTDLPGNIEASGIVEGEETEKDTDSRDSSGGSLLARLEETEENNNAKDGTVVVETKEKAGSQGASDSSNGRGVDKERPQRTREEDTNRRVMINGHIGPADDDERTTTDNAVKISDEDSPVVTTTLSPDGNGTMMEDEQLNILAVQSLPPAQSKPSFPLRVLPQNRDTKALIEEKLKRAHQLRRVPFRFNQTRLNRETGKTLTRDDGRLRPFERLTVNKETEKVTTNKEMPVNDLNEVDVYALEEALRKSSADGCARECGTGPAMTCRYELALEWFHTMSKACYSCPTNVTECFKPHCIPADGVMRTIAVINRSLPGPLIQVCEGDTIIAKVTNLMMESTTTLHWHGQHQVQTPFMDGVPSVTQCPITPGASFTYSFTAAQPGTHFYHSHSGMQRGDGAFGGLIVRRAQSKERHRWTYDRDLPEHTITILDWSHQLGLQKFTHHHHAGGPNKPDTILVNGRGIVGNNALPPASFTVTSGLRYRFRLINAGVLNCPIRISIDNHRIAIIATDGNDIQPYIVDWLVTYAGERWDFVLEAKQKVDNYWIRFIGLMDCDERFTSAHQGAVLHYRNASTSLPMGVLAYNATAPPFSRPPRVLNALNAGMSDGTTLVHQLSGLARPQSWLATRKPDRKLVLAYDFNPLDNELFHKPNMYGFSQVLDVGSSKVYTPQLNHISLKLPPFPLLTQPKDLTDDMLCANMDQEKCKQTYCECTNIINIPLGSIVEVIFIDQGFIYDANHPFHVHGHYFYVVGMDRLGSNVTSQRVLELDAQGMLQRNLGDPPLKDTVTVPDGGYTIIRFLANNPGYWLLHCHIDFHVEVGMAVVLKVGEDSDMPRPPRGFPQCGNFDPTQEVTPPSVTEPDNRLEEIDVTGEKESANPGFGSRWKYNMSSSAVSSFYTSFYTTFSIFGSIVLLLFPLDASFNPNRLYSRT